MKMKTLLAGLLLLATAVTHAQGLHLGGKVGANLYKIDGQSFKNEFSFGYQAGAFLEIELSKKFAIQPEVLFVQTSQDTTSSFSSVYNTDNLSHVTLNYLSIPVLASIKLSKVFAIQVGPQYGILLNSSRNLVDNGKDAFKQGDFSLIGGIQFNLAAFRLYGRYAIGLTSINDIDEEHSWKSQSIQLGVGYAIF